LSHWCREKTVSKNQATVCASRGCRQDVHGGGDSPHSPRASRQHAQHSARLEPCPPGPGLWLLVARASLEFFALHRRARKHSMPHFWRTCNATRSHHNRPGHWLPFDSTPPTQAGVCGCTSSQISNTVSQPTFAFAILSGINPEPVQAQLTGKRRGKQCDLQCV
jgi:hypothetical protein